MTAKTSTCVALACNTCGEFLNADGEDGFQQHYDNLNLAEAVDVARSFGWIAHPDGFAICDTEDPEHSAAIRELMPPEPVPACDGQTEIPFPDASVCVLTAPAGLDVYAAPKLREDVVDAVRTGHYRIVVDLTGTAVIDPTGLGVLVGQLRRCTAHGGWLRLAGAHGQVLSALRLTGLHKAFAIADTVADAINYETEGVTKP
jgi:anti-sigma B factor antagonist